MAILQGINAKIEYTVKSISELYLKSNVNFFISNESVFNPKLVKNGFDILEDSECCLSYLIQNVLKTNKPESIMNSVGTLTIYLYPNYEFPFNYSSEFSSNTTNLEKEYFTLAFTIEDVEFGNVQIDDNTWCSFSIVIDNKTLLEDFLAEILKEESQMRIKQKQNPTEDSTKCHIAPTKKEINKILKTIGYKIEKNYLIDIKNKKRLLKFDFTDKKFDNDELMHYLHHYIYIMESLNLKKYKRKKRKKLEQLKESCKPKLEAILKILLEKVVYLR